MLLFPLGYLEQLPGYFPFLFPPIMSSSLFADLGGNDGSHPDVGKEGRAWIRVGNLSLTLS
jgi:hypothetical protein